MTLREIDILARMEHFHDLQREAEYERQLRRGLVTQSYSNLLHRALTGLGRNLVMLGNSLQERYCDCNLNVTIETGQQ
jgi:hypothetical protein